MKYLVAISFCDEDSAFAESLWKSFRRRRAGSYFYKRKPTWGPLILGYHQSIYAKAHSRIYLLRNRSFLGKIVSFELNCGRDLANNYILPMEPSVLNNIPNDYLFLSDPGWIWLSHPRKIEIGRIADQILRSI